MRFKKNDLLICKPEESERNPYNKNFEIYARCIYAENGIIKLDRYMKCGELSVRHGDRQEIAEDVFFERPERPVYVPMNKKEMQEFKQGLHLNRDLKTDYITKETLQVVECRLKEKENSFKQKRTASYAYKKLC